jgi:hypothetical protein
MNELAPEPRLRGSRSATTATFPSSDCSTCGPSARPMFWVWLEPAEVLLVERVGWPNRAVSDHTVR